MAVVQLSYYSNIDTSIEDMQNTLDGNFIGHHRVSLTNYDNTSLPAIAAGSIVENNGSLFKFETETAISGSPSDGTVYIYLVPSGDPTLGTATVTPTFTNTAPTWSDTKQGWYGTSGSANYRYLEFKIIKATTSYTKSIYTYDDDVNFDIVNVSSSVKYNNTPISGFLIDGTPIYEKLIQSCTTTANTFYLKFTHGITNAYTDNRILGVSFQNKESSSSKCEINYYETSPDKIDIKYIDWDDTYVYVHNYFEWIVDSTITSASLLLRYK